MRGLVPTLQALVGVGLIVAGVALVCVPAAFMVAGVLILLDRVTSQGDKK